MSGEREARARSLTGMAPSELANTLRKRPVLAGELVKLNKDAKKWAQSTVKTKFVRHEGFVLTYYEKEGGAVVAKDGRM